MEIRYNVLQKRYASLMCDYADLELQYNQLRNEEFERNKVRLSDPITSSVSRESAIVSSDRTTKDFEPQMVRTIQSTNKSLYTPTICSDALRRVRFADKTFD